MTLKGVDSTRLPYGDRYNIELIYDYTPQDLLLDRTHVMGIDLGLNNIVSATRSSLLECRTQHSVENCS
ncbi:MAG: hypothetical protein ACTSWW_07580 [Promethearchaeota archaeon]